MIERGKISWVDLGEPHGTHRPSAARSWPYRPTPTTRVGSGPTWSFRSPRSLALPGNVVLPASATGLSKDSADDVTAIHHPGKGDLGEPVGILPRYLTDDVARGLHRILDLLAVARFHRSEEEGR